MQIARQPIASAGGDSAAAVNACQSRLGAGQRMHMLYGSRPRLDTVSLSSPAHHAVYPAALLAVVLGGRPKPPARFQKSTSCIQLDSVCAAGLYAPGIETQGVSYKLAVRAAKRAHLDSANDRHCGACDASLAG
jgi:hypothetical protein